MPTHPHPTDKLTYGLQPQPQRDRENVELENHAAEDASRTDDPGDAQRSSKMGNDGDGEEETR